MNVTSEIAKERQRQIDVEGWSPEHDDQHSDGEMLQAATMYFQHATKPGSLSKREDGAPLGWPWASEWWKPKGPQRDLVRAGALCLAEIERLRRSQAAERHAQERLRMIVDALSKISTLEAAE